MKVGGTNASGAPKAADKAALLTPSSDATAATTKIDTADQYQSAKGEAKAGLVEQKQPSKPKLSDRLNPLRPLFQFTKANKEMVGDVARIPILGPLLLVPMAVVSVLRQPIVWTVDAVDLATRPFQAIAWVGAKAFEALTGQK